MPGGTKNPDSSGNRVPLESGFFPSLVKGRANWHFSLPNTTSSNHTITLTLKTIELLHIGNLSEKRLPRAATLPDGARRTFPNWRGPSHLPARASRGRPRTSPPPSGVPRPPRPSCARRLPRSVRGGLRLRTATGSSPRRRRTRASRCGLAARPAGESPVGGSPGERRSTPCPRFGE